MAVAEELNSSASDATNLQALYRTAVGRAYYAAFCKAKQFAETKDKIVFDPRDSIHSSVISHFLGAAESSRKKVGTELDRLKLRRIAADYQLPSRFGRLDVVTAIGASRRILEALKAIS